jgi:uncharacterized membrane protein AbrB (regulator of aidB expression)
VDDSIKFLCAATVGGVAARRLGLPGGTLMGAVLAAALVGVAGAGTAPLPPLVTPVAQVLAATMLSFSIDRHLLTTLRVHGRLVAASFLLTAALWAMTALTASATGFLEPAGTVLGSAPAGSMVALVGSDKGLSLAAISMLMVLRVVLVGGVLSAYLRLRALPAWGRLGARRGWGAARWRGR